jgi:triacylglycerol esterase/lipase EstA (alpha/beta hydrolase family)
MLRVVEFRPRHPGRRVRAQRRWPAFHQRGRKSRQPAQYVQSYVVSEYAWLKVGVSAGDRNPFLATFYLNGVPVGEAIAQPMETKYACLKVPIGAVRFARRQAGGGPPVPSDNVIEMHPFPGTGIVVGPCMGYESCGGDAGVLSLSFEAVSPIVMVHGIRAGPDTFDQFVGPFRSARFPYKAVRVGSGEIPTVGEGLLRQRVGEVATEFGAKHVHIIAHSKGGLWSRAFITDTSRIPSNSTVSVMSLSTLTTPHQGSVVADGVMTGHLRLGSLADGLALLNWDNIRDLPVGLMAGYNREPRNRLPDTMSVDGAVNKLICNTYSADANLNHNINSFGYGTIEANEGEGFFLQGGLLYAYLQQWKRVDTTTDAQGRTRLQAIPNARPYPLNDMMLTLESAQYAPRCQHVVLLQPVVDGATFSMSFANNHTTVKNAANALVLLWTVDLRTESVLRIRE